LAEIPPGAENKDLARTRAIARWPAQADLFTRKYEVDRAETCLIALAVWGGRRAMSKCEPLPDRRGADLVASVHEGLRSTASIGRFTRGTALPSTLRNGKENGKTGKETGKETGKSNKELAKAELLRLLLPFRR
jgi:hypothetical protein